MNAYLFKGYIPGNTVSISTHLMDDEEVIEYCGTDYWTWVCTDKRVVKYKQGGGGAEQMHDISFDEIVGISLVNNGKDDRLGFFSLLLMLAGFALAMLLPHLGILGFILFAVGLVLMYRWWKSDGSYFEFRGTGLLQAEPEQWRIDEKSADDPDQIREFVKTVRSQLSV